MKVFVSLKVKEANLPYIWSFPKALQRDAAEAIKGRIFELCPIKETELSAP